MYGTIATAMTRWYAEHYGQHSDPEWLTFLNIYEAEVVKKLAEHRTPHENLINGKRVFGASGAGNCTRKAIYRWRGIPGEKPSGERAMTYFDGHMTEPFVLALLKSMGWKIDDQVDVQREPFATKADGLIIESPGFDCAGDLMSVKSMGFKGTYGKNLRGFAELVEAGIRKAEPGYYAQAQAELWASGRKAVLFVVKARDQLGAWPSLYTELVERDERFMGHLEWTWQSMWLQKDLANPTAFVLNADSMTFEPLPAPGDVRKGWRDSPNWKADGRFSPCGTEAQPCEFARVCRGVK